MEHVGLLFLPSPDSSLKQQRTGWLLHLRQRAMSSRIKNTIIIEKMILNQTLYLQWVQQ